MTEMSMQHETFSRQGIAVSQEESPSFSRGEDVNSQLIDLKPSEVLAAAKQQRLALRNPPKMVDAYLDSLLRQGLPNTVAFLKDNAELI